MISVVGGVKRGLSNASLWIINDASGKAAQCGYGQLGDDRELSGSTLIG